MTWVVERLKIQGVKGVLDRAGEFTLASKGSPKSLAIFAPNACGKSGYADAVEYLFSEDGSVAHLGKGGPDSECGGKHAIPHVLAEERGVEPMVSIRMVDAESAKRLEVRRPVKIGRDDPIPHELAEVVRRSRAHRILRQHDLRRFVVDMTPGQKYGELSRWLGLGRLEKVLKHLVTTSNTLESTDFDREIDERVLDLALHTEEAVCVYDEAAVLAWCAGQGERHLGGGVSVGSVSEIGSAVKQLKERRDLIILSSGAAGSYQAKLNLEGDIEALARTDGILDRCETASARAASAERETRRVRGAAENSAFQGVWSAARQMMESEDIGECPVCFTPWSRTEVGSQVKALDRLERSLGLLAELAASQEKESKVLGELKSALGELDTCLEGVSEHAMVLSLEETCGASSALRDAIANMLEGDLASPQLRGECGKALAGSRQLVADKIKPALQQLVISGVPLEASEIEATVTHLEALSEGLLRLRSLHREREKYREVEGAYVKVAAAIREETASLVNSIMTALREEMGCVFKTVHPAGSVPNIHVVPDTDSRTLKLRVDFHSDQRTVPPAGYLSESQINTLGLSLFISSVRLFNREFPFVLLDDIVSSYDADHRARIVDVVAERLDGFQVLLTTHDWMFYSMLRSRLMDKGWQFERITGWDLEKGPRRSVDVFEARHIDELISQGDPAIAGNALRQYMEGWLDKMCDDFEAYTPHRRGTRQFHRTLFDLWGPFVERLKKIRGGFFSDRIAGEECYQRLTAHPLLNYYSHAQSAPYEWPATGDVAYVWNEFQSFQQLLCCASCDSTFAYDRDAKKLYCTCGGAIFGNQVSA